MNADRHRPAEPTTLDFSELTSALARLHESLLEAAGELLRVTDALLRRYAIEHMDIAESDIKRVEFRVAGPVIVLKNWRRVLVADGDRPDSAAL